tara:strand:- start:10618 stop:12915 length:2298 start_codon:yes stop_codon:yes gene_type:complete
MSDNIAFQPWPFVLWMSLVLGWGHLGKAQTMPNAWTHAPWTASIDNEDLTFPWAGGLTAPQWSPFDADLDGDDDLFAFDRDGSRILVFERATGEIEAEEVWILRWDWTENWPSMVDWCLLRDYNCDGKADIFTSFQNGIRVHTNTTQPGEGPSFDPNPIALSAEFDFGNGASDLPVICIGMDLPAILDHDDDGDLDIITFTETATTLYRFQGQTSCGLDLVCTNRCYGMLEEAAENNDLFIGPEFECSFNVVEPRTGLHAGGSITSLQLESGGPKDLIISDVTYPTTLGVVLEEGGSGLDSAVFVDPSFPDALYGDQALNLPRFPAAFHLDVDHDGVRDLLFSPNTPLETNDDAGVHFFRNDGTEDAPSWAFQDSAFLQRDMVDVGRGAYPVFADFDADGLMDLAIANKERYEGIDQTPAAIASFRNVGSTTEPVFERNNDDWIPLSSYQIESPYPAFGDLDGDGDLDVIVGDELGYFHQFDNVAGPGEWPVFVLAALSIPEEGGSEALDVGQFAAPQLIDMDNDGDLDMVVGEMNGYLTLIEQSSLGTWSIYDSPIHGETWGGIAVDNLLGINGWSVPALTMTDDGLRILVANETGTVQYFGLATENWDADLPLQADNILGTSHGYRAASAWHDLDGDGLLDGLLGIQNGGVLAFQGAPTSSAPPWVENVSSVLDWKLSPNPGSHALNWASTQPWTGVLEVWNGLGACIHREEVVAAKHGNMNPSAWPSGLYVVRPVIERPSLMVGNEKGALVGAPLTWVKLQH